MTVPTNDFAADIIIPVYNQYSFTRNLIESIYRYTGVPFHLYLIDNASTDETADIDKIFTRDITVVHNPQNLGWCAGINQGVELGRNPNVIFMNNEVEVSRGWLENLIGFLETHPRIGAVGPVNSNPNDAHFIDRVRQSNVPQIPNFLTDDLHERNKILKYHFNGAGLTTVHTLALFCAVLKRRTINEVGRLNERFIEIRAEEDYCRRLRKAGYVLGLSLDTYVNHNSGLAAKTIFDSYPDRAAAINNKR